MMKSPGGIQERIRVRIIGMYVRNIAVAILMILPILSSIFYHTFNTAPLFHQ